MRRSLWDFISDDATKTLYRLLIERVRAGNCVKFEFRCDAPAYRRFLEMNILLLENSDIQFTTHTIRVEERPLQNLLSKNISRMEEEVIIVCSWCNKIKVDEDDWQEIEDFLKTSGLFENEILPQPSHGMCDNCYKIVSEKFQK
jgi:hypothetical protein